jgi:hypothetical protein
MLFILLNRDVNLHTTLRKVVTILHNIGLSSDLGDVIISLSVGSIG